MKPVGLHMFTSVYTPSRTKHCFFFHKRMGHQLSYYADGGTGIMRLALSQVDWTVD